MRSRCCTGAGFRVSDRAQNGAGENRTAVEDATGL